MSTCAKHPWQATYKVQPLSQEKKDKKLQFTETPGIQAQRSGLEVAILCVRYVVFWEKRKEKEKGYCLKKLNHDAKQCYLEKLSTINSDVFPPLTYPHIVNYLIFGWSA